jgi:DNA polymerase I-like protein with 3'-5' exonuclease and polymerase domains
MNLVVLDFESFYDKTYSLSRLTTESYIRDPRFQVILVAVKRNDEPTQWFTGTHAEIRAWLQQWDIPNSYLLCHNTAFDGAILAWHFGLKAKYYLDTLSMAKPIAGNSSASLAALAKRFLLGEKGTEVVNALGKKREDFSPDEMLSYARYCANDVDLTSTLYRVLRQFSTPRELYVIDLLLRMFIDPVIELDRAVLEQHLVNVRTKKQQLMDRIDQTIGRDQLMSNPKFALLLQQLGVDPPTKLSAKAKNNDGSPKLTFTFGKTDPAFKALLEHEDPRVQTVVSARLGIKSTLEETRTEAFLRIEERGCLPIMLNYYGAHTGRASGADKINLQNLPQDGALRRSMRPPAGHALIAGDSSQIEARMTAYLAGQWDLVEDFRNGADVYSGFATDVFGRPISNIPECKKERFVGKTCILGLGFGTGKDKLKTTLKVGKISVDIPIEEADRIVRLYRSKYPEIVKLWRSAEEALWAMSRGLEYQFGVGINIRCTWEGVHLPNGMLIRYPNLRRGADGFEYDSRKGPVKIYGAKMVENVVQALARIVVFDQMCTIDQELRRHDEPSGRLKVVLTVHDEVVICVPQARVEWASALMSTHMRRTPKWCTDLPINCEVGSGLNYASCK